MTEEDVRRIIREELQKLDIKSTGMERREELERSLWRVLDEKVVNVFDVMDWKVADALHKIENREPYYKIIQFYYGDRLTLEEIADRLGVDISTVTRNKRRILEKLTSIIWKI